jgi:hypothetical protein
VKQTYLDQTSWICPRSKPGNSPSIPFKSHQALKLSYNNGAAEAAVAKQKADEAAAEAQSKADEAKQKWPARSFVPARLLV